MRRHRHNQNVRDYSKDQVGTAVSTRMAVRHHLLAPCPIKPVDIYRHMWKNEERLALRTLRASMPSILRSDTDVTLAWDVRVFEIHTAVDKIKAPIRLYVEFGRSLPLPNTNPWSDSANKLGISRLPDAMLDTLEEWAKRWTKLHVEKLAVERKVENVFDVCNTMGQIHRLWPNLCSFMPERAQEILRKKKVRSKLPEEVLHYDTERDPDNRHPILDAEWTPKALQPFDALITEALLLPETVEDFSWPIAVVT